MGASSTEHFSHFYETCVGSGHMSLTLREDWRTHIRMAAKDLGVKHIRGHGLLDDDMSVSYAYGKHAFYNIDSLVDVLMSVGARRTHARIEHTHPARPAALLSAVGLSPLPSPLSAAAAP